jgi:hypothetical protein
MYIKIEHDVPLIVCNKRSITELSILHYCVWVYGWWYQLVF